MNGRRRHRSRSGSVSSQKLAAGAGEEQVPPAGQKATLIEEEIMQEGTVSLYHTSEWTLLPPPLSLSFYPSPLPPSLSSSSLSPPSPHRSRCPCLKTISRPALTPCLSCSSCSIPSTTRPQSVPTSGWPRTHIPSLQTPHGTCVFCLIILSLNPFTFPRPPQFRG